MHVPRLCSTGEVVPIGGCRESGRGGPTALIPGDLFVEPMSNRPARVGGAFLNDSEVLPANGGYIALLDATMLATEARVLDHMR